MSLRVPSECPAVIDSQFLVADPTDLILLLGGQVLPYGRLHLYDAEGLGVAEHLHVLESFEGVGEDVPFASLSV